MCVRNTNLAKQNLNILSKTYCRHNFFRVCKGHILKFILNFGKKMIYSKNMKVLLNTSKIGINAAYIRAFIVTILIVFSIITCFSGRTGMHG